MGTSARRSLDELEPEASLNEPEANESCQKEQPLCDTTEIICRTFRATPVQRIIPNPVSNIHLR